MKHAVELCAGTAVTGLTALCGELIQPITGYMGGKRRWAPALAKWALGRPDHLHLIDGGPWGEVWSLYAAGRGRDLADELSRLAARYPFAPDLWNAMAAEAPFPDPVERAAQYLAIQARSVSCVPVWWSGTRWEGPTGSRRATPEKIAAQRGRCTEAGQKSSKHKRHACDPGPGYQQHGGVATAGQKREAETAKTGNYRGGLMRSATLAVRALVLAEAVPWDRVTVHHGLVQDFAPIPGSRVLFDPPYRGAPRYAVVFPRAEVLATCERHAAVAASVAVCEGEQLHPAGDWSAAEMAEGEVVTYAGLGSPPFRAKAAKTHQLPILFGDRALAMGAL